MNMPTQAFVLGIIPKLNGHDATFYRPWSGLGIIAGLLAVSWLLARYVDPWLRIRLERLLGVRGRRPGGTPPIG